MIIGTNNDMKISSTLTNTEWQVIFNEGQHWRIGVYRPRFTERAAITELEQHSCPESFLLLSGNLTMLYRTDSGELAEKQLVANELVTFTEPHAGFSPDASGVALVVENAKFETIYTDVHTAAETRHVRVD